MTGNSLSMNSAIPTIAAAPIGDFLSFVTNLLITLSTSTEWASLQSALLHGSSGGILINALAATTLHSLSDNSSALLTTDSQHTTDTISPPPGLEDHISALIEITWEKIHLGTWRDVDAFWRDAYSFACLLQAIYFSLKIATRLHDLHQDGGALEPKCKRDVMRSLDMAALMGGDLFRKGYIDAFIDHTIQAMHAMKEQRSQYTTTTTTTTTTTNNNNNGDAFSTQLHALYADAVSGSNGGGNRTPTPCIDRDLLERLPPGSCIHIAAQHNIHVRSMPSLETFFVEYFKSKPLIITDAMTAWPALRAWRDLNYVLSILGHRTVPIEIGKHYVDHDWEQKLMTFEDFLHVILTQQDIKSDDAFGAALIQSPTSRHTRDNDKSKRMHYLAQHSLFDQVPRLKHDILEPEYCAVGRAAPVANAWCGPPGTITPAHTDPYHNILCQVIGKKYVRLYPPSETDKLYPPSCELQSHISPRKNEGGTIATGTRNGKPNQRIDKESTHVVNMPLLSNTSCVDIDAPDVEQFPLFTSASFVDCILEEGQMLYIPKGWWHYIKSLTFSWSVSFWYDDDDDNDNDNKK